MESILEFVKQFLLNPNVQTALSGIIGTWLVSLFPALDPYRETAMTILWVVVGSLLVGNKIIVEPAMVKSQGLTLAQAAYRPFSRRIPRTQQPLQPGGFDR